MSSSFNDKGKGMAAKWTSKLREEAIRERDKAISRPGDTMRPRKDDPVDDLVRMTAAGIGFVSEAMHHRRQKKLAKTADSHPEAQQKDAADTPNPNLGAQLNEAIWELEDADRQAAGQETGKSATPTSDSQGPHGVEESAKSKEPKKDPVQAFLDKHNHEAPVPSDKQLALPVILPQRRPKARERGFVRAYAPVLADVGVSQEVFLDFLDSFNKTLEPNPWLQAINLASIATTPAPEPISMLLGLAVDFAAYAIIEAATRAKSNTSLDRINREFFIPRGLIGLVVTWKPDAADEELVTAVDFEGKRVESHTSTPLGQQMKDVLTHKVTTKEWQQQLGSRFQGKIRGSNMAAQWPEPAPLIFPALEAIASDAGIEAEGKKKKKNAFDRGEAWMDEYMDRRAQTKWMTKNPDLPVATMMPKPEYRSRYADPNHPAASGDIVALVTGGRWRYGRDEPEKGDEDADDSEDEQPKKQIEKEPRGAEEIKQDEEDGGANVAKVSIESKGAGEANKVEEVHGDKASGQYKGGQEGALSSDDRGRDEHVESKDDKKAMKEKKEREKKERREQEKKEKREKEREKKEKKEQEKREKEQKEKEKKEAKKAEKANSPTSLSHLFESVSSINTT